MKYQEARLNMTVEMPGSAVVTGAASGMSARESEILGCGVGNPP